jgi:hypothetical protein
MLVRFDEEYEVARLLACVIGMVNDKFSGPEWISGLRQTCSFESRPLNAR